jgi:p-hydroxybenzoate 3-monooxygenase
MTVSERTQVGIVGAGPAGLLLSHLLALSGVDSVCVEARSRAHCEARQRAGMLEPGTADLLRATGVGQRLDAEGLPHDGIYLQFGGERHHLNFRELTGGHQLVIYAQTEIVKDLIAARAAAGAAPEFEARGVSVADLDSASPRLAYTDARGVRHEVACDAIAGCDGFHGVTRRSTPGGGLTALAERSYPYAWLGILAAAPPSTDEVIYCRHDDGFALHSMRTPEVGRLYLQVPADEDIGRWPDDRIWSELARRLAVPGWTLATGPVLQKSLTPMRSFVAAPMRYGRLFLAGDAAHIVPPTGAKGLNLAVADVTALATALTSMLRYGDPSLADAYSGHCLERVWQATHLSWWMTSMMHIAPGQDAFDSELQLAQLRRLTSSGAAATAFAEASTGCAAPARGPSGPAGAHGQHPASPLAWLPPVPSGQ